MILNKVNFAIYFKDTNFLINNLKYYIINIINLLR